MSTSEVDDAQQARSSAAELSYDEFTLSARRAGVPPEIWPELYPMARDLRALAAQINQLTPELHAEIPVSALQSGTGD